MAAIVMKCRYSGNYILTGIRSESSLVLIGGRVNCPYCSAEHVWIAAETDRPDCKPTKTVVRLAG